MLNRGAPEVASKTDKFGRTCLHLAVKKDGAAEIGYSSLANSPREKPPIGTIELIHSLDTSQVKVKDKANDLPLHSACTAGCSFSAAKFLIAEYPESIHIKNKDENRPKEVAIASGRCSKSVLDLLLELSDKDNTEAAQ